MLRTKAMACEDGGDSNEPDSTPEHYMGVGPLTSWGDDAHAFLSFDRVLDRVDAHHSSKRGTIGMRSILS